MIRIRRRHLHAAGYTLIGLLAFVLASVGLYAIGRAQTPLDSAGRPMVLTPNLVWTQAFRAQVAHWPARLRTADGVLVRALAGQGGDLYTTADSIVNTQADLSTLIEEITLASAPPTMEGLRGMALSAAQQYADAAQRVAGVIAAPSAARQADATQAVQVARNYLLALEDSAWLKNP